MATAPQTQRILVVDDDQALADMMQEALEGAGYRVTVCAQSERALPLIATEPPDLVILDVRMPQVGGLDILDHLRADPRTHAIPVLMCTAAFSGDRPVWQDEMARRGATILFKPFALDQLLDQVRALLGGGRRQTADGGESIVDS